MKKNKLYISTVILVSIILFSTAVLCKQCGVKGEEKISSRSEAGEDKPEGFHPDIEASTSPADLFYSGFDSMNGLNCGSYCWEIVTENGNSFLKPEIETDEQRVIFGNESWTDYEIKVNAKIDSGNGYGIYYRYVGEPENITGYIFQYDIGYDNSFLVRKFINGSENVYPFASIKMPEGFKVYGQSHEITITVEGNHHIIKVDNQVVLDFQDNDFTEGMVGFRKWSNSDITFDDAYVVGVTKEGVSKLKVGETYTFKMVSVYIPPEIQESQPSIDIKSVDEPLPLPQEGSSSVGNAYDITSEGDITGPVLITLNYDPSGLSPEANEENLYIARKTDDSWDTIPYGLVDTQNNTISASIEHFSIFCIFENLTQAVYDIVGVAQRMTGEEIEKVFYSDLTGEIRQDILNEGIKPQDVTAVINARLSLVTRAASAIIPLSNIISKTAGLAIAAIEDTTEAIVEAVVLTAGSVFFDYIESEGGNFVLTMYDSASLGYEIGTYAKNFKGNPQLLVAKAASWVLAMEMEYINKNMPKAFSGIWKFNPSSTSKLKIYAVFIDAKPQEGSAAAKGIKFYYYDEGQDNWVNYYDDMIHWKVVFEPVEMMEKVEEFPEEETIEGVVEEEGEEIPETNQGQVDENYLIEVG